MNKNTAFLPDSARKCLEYYLSDMEEAQKALEAKYNGWPEIQFIGEVIRRLRQDIQR